ncbi:MAG: RluA family pseudouridine synthase [Clostridia bacterium]|nr:RluA family pseudouridine synthase [Clostridia bacterium]
MEKYAFKVKERGKISKQLADNYGLSYSAFASLVRKGDIRINGLRVERDIIAECGNEIVFFINELKNRQYNVKTMDEVCTVFENDEILVAYKPQGIQTVGENSLESLLNERQMLIACHRLDRNTMGLVIFAKSERAFEEIKQCFSSGLVNKRYRALVVGECKPSARLNGYLFKDSKKSICYVYDAPRAGCKNIVTEYKAIEKLGELTLLEIKPITGRTHQIRAHLAHNGIYIVGDGKYGLNSVNRRYGVKEQLLCCVEVCVDAPSDMSIASICGKKFVKEVDLSRYLKNKCE